MVTYLQSISRFESVEFTCSYYNNRFGSHCPHRYYYFNLYHVLTLI